MALPSNINLVLTDPPYGTGKKQRRGDVFFDDPSDPYTVIFVLRQLSYLLADDGVMVVICDYRLAYDLVPALPLRDHASPALSAAAIRTG